MSETGIDIGMPSEGNTAAPEQLSEDAKQRFAAAAAAMKAIQKEEKRSKKRDDKVAKTIIQFLNDDRYAHLFVLISRLVGRDCPSVFILALLSLIHTDAQSVIQEYLKELGQKTSKEAVDENTQLIPGGNLDSQANRALFEWITRLQMVLSLETQRVLSKIMLDEENIDGTVLQLTTFVLQEFFRSDIGGKREAAFPSLQGLSVSILQSVFEPFMDQVQLPKKNGMNDEGESE